MELPAGYRLRAPALGDLDVVADVLIADELDEAGQIVLGVDFLRAEWSRVGFNLARRCLGGGRRCGTIAGPSWTAWPRLGGTLGCGRVSDQIPAIAEAGTSVFGLAIATVGGDVHGVGEWRRRLSFGEVSRSLSAWDAGRSSDAK